MDVNHKGLHKKSAINKAKQVQIGVKMIGAKVMALVNHSCSDLGEEPHFSVLSHHVFRINIKPHSHSCTYESFFFRE